MNSTLTTQPFADIETPLLAVAVGTGTAFPPTLATLDQASGGALGRAFASGDFKGKRDESAAGLWQRQGATHPARRGGQAG